MRHQLHHPWLSDELRQNAKTRPSLINGSEESGLILTPCLALLLMHHGPAEHFPESVSETTRDHCPNAQSVREAKTKSDSGPAEMHVSSCARSCFELLVRRDIT